MIEVISANDKRVSAPTVRGLGVGQRHFGRFVLLKKLGHGGMGEVWLARDERDDRDCALKLLAEPFRWDLAAIADIKKEAGRMRELVHPNIVQIYELVEDDVTGAAIVMEAVDGCSLDKIRLSTSTGVLSTATIAAWLPDLCCALDFAHLRAHLVHLDIKPSNLLIDQAGRIKIADFGVAHCLASSANYISSCQSGGTLAYMSPQQVMGELPHPSDDIYSLGATLYELITGRVPFDHGDVRAQVKRRRPESMEQRRRAFGVVGDEIPAVWEKLVGACLAKRPEDRPKTAGEIALWLNQSACEPSAAVLRKNRTGIRLRASLVCTTIVGVIGLIRWTGNEFWAGAGVPIEPTELHASPIGAWNFDGNGAEITKGDLHLHGAQFVPVANRWGRIDRALSFNGSGGLHSAGHNLRWSPGQPFSTSLWARPVDAGEGKSVVLSLQGEDSSSVLWRLSVVGGRFEFESGWGDGKFVAVASPERIAPDRWTHLLVVDDGRVLQLFVDGKPVSRVERRRLRSPLSPRPATLYVAGDAKDSRLNFAGSLDQLRVWGRALIAGEISRESNAQPEPRFTLSRSMAPDPESIPAVLAAEFGSEGQVANWREVVRWQANDIRESMGREGLNISASRVFVKNDQNQYLSVAISDVSNRLGGLKLVDMVSAAAANGPGMERGSSGYVLVRKPVRVFVAPTMQASGPGEVLRTGPLPKGVSTFALTWREKASSPERSPYCEVKLRMGDNRVFGVRRSPGDSGTYAISLGDFDRPQLSRQVFADNAEVEFTLVAHSGGMEFRGVYVHGGAVLFRSGVSLSDFDVSAVKEAFLAGVLEAVWVAEN